MHTYYNHRPGAIQNGVPMTVLLFCIVSVKSADTPKSASFVDPSDANNIFPALTSCNNELLEALLFIHKLTRCMLLCECR